MLAQIGAGSGWPGVLVAVLAYLATINFALAAFNMVPGFPLDGGRILRSIVWGYSGDYEKATRWASNAGQVFGYILIGFGFANILGGTLMSGLWFVVIGWFLTNVARSSYQQVLVQKVLSGVAVGEVMTKDVPTVSADMTVRQFVDEIYLHHEFSCYPVVREGKTVGIIGVEEVRGVPAEERDIVTVEKAAQGYNDDFAVSPGDDAYEALEKLTKQKVCRLLVMDENGLKGTVSQDMVMRLIQMKAQADSTY